MTADSSRPRPPGVGVRKKIQAATEAALWALSNGRCYAPGCPIPVVMETRAGVYRKNAWVAHIYGVKPSTPRFRADLPPDERDAFTNLLLLCQAHHDEVDDPRDGEQRYPASLLLRWKSRHEGADGPALAALGRIDPDELSALLTAVFTPPLQRLEAITQRLERTGEVNAQTVRELKQVISVLSVTSEGFDARTARTLGYAAEVLGSSSFHTAARRLDHAAEVLPDAADKMVRAAQTMAQFH